MMGPLDDSGFAVAVMSPATVPLSVGGSKTGMLAYGWKPDDPLVVTVRIAVAQDTIPVEADIHPEGLICLKCSRPISWGGYACRADNRIICLGCGQKLEKLGMTSQDWTVGLSLFFSMLAGQDDYKHMPGEVQLYRSHNGELTLVFSNKDTKEFIRVLAPYENMRAFLERVIRFRSTLSENLETEYVGTGVEALEKLANEVE